MPTVIDSLVVEVAMDATKLADGERKVAQSTAKTRDNLKKNGEQIEGSFRAAAKAVTEFGEIATESFVAVGAAVFGVVEAAKQLYDFADASREGSSQLGVLARTLDVSGSELSTWGNTARFFGGTAAGATQSIASLQGSLEQFALTGQSSVIPYFRALGVSLVGNNGQLKTASNLYRELAHNQRLQAITAQDPARAAAILQGIGITDPGMINAILAGPQAFDAAQAMAAQYAPTAADIAAARQLTQDHLQLDMAMNKLSATILTDLTPAIDGALKHAIDLVKFLQGEVEHPHIPAKVKATLKPAVDLAKQTFHTSAKADIDYSFPSLSSIGRNAGAWMGALEVQSKYGIPASVVYAQWALESGYGEHMPAGSNNPFGIKARAGQPYVTAMTNEFRHGHMERVPQKFAVFKSISDAFEAYGHLLATSPKFAKARQHEDNATAFVQAMAGIYATDKDYARNIMRIINGGSSGATNNTTSSHRETHIGQITVHTQARDAHGIAKALRPAIEDVSVTAQRNHGAQ